MILHDEDGEIRVSGPRCATCDTQDGVFTCRNCGAYMCWDCTTIDEDGQCYHERWSSILVDWPDASEPSTN